MIPLFSTFSNNILQYWVAGQNMGASSRHHVLSLHRVVSSVFQRTRQFTNFSESKQIYWSIATANTFILVFGNISNIFCSLFQRVSFTYHQRNVRSRVSVSVSRFQVSVSAFMAKSRSRRLRSRLRHCLSLIYSRLCHKMPISLVVR